MYFIYASLLLSDSQTAHLLALSLDTLSSWDWTKLKPEAWDSVGPFQMGHGNKSARAISAASHCAN